MNKYLLKLLIFFILNIFSEKKINNNFEIKISIEEEKKDDNNKYIEEILDVIRRPSQNNSSDELPSTLISKTHSQPKKEWTVLIYIAGDNNLYKFALRNIEQLKQVGSNELLNILVHFDYRKNNKLKKTRRFYIERNNLLEVGTYDWMDSGDEKTLISAGDWAIKNYPSNNFALILWNHGSGDINFTGQMGSKLINSSDLFFYNSLTNQIELDKSINFSEFLIKNNKERGICYDDKTLNYLDDDKLIKAFNEICKNINISTGKKKIDIILLDACLMAGIGTAYLCSQYANYMTASQEVVMGPGYNYQTMLKILSKSKIEPEYFSNFIVENYEKTYSPITQDYTESALKLNNIEQLIIDTNKLAENLKNNLKNDSSGLLKKTIKYCASPDVCISFEEPSYVDFYNLIDNIFNYIEKIDIKINNKITFSTETKSIINNLKRSLKNVIIKNVTGKNYKKANGISIYFPQYSIDKSFSKTFFGKKTKWLEFLQTVI